MILILLPFPLAEFRTLVSVMLSQSVAICKSRRLLDTFRAVYTVEFEEAIYVLHCFQKKSKRGNETPQQDKNMIGRRLKAAREEHHKWLKQQPERKKKS